ncbi:MAG: dihydropteroate synthase [Bacteroidetes bacterium]|nr:dihydropteroate synthase [Bacteroidota bacterium]MBU1719689.1 dihydropteroate synthase [Bacteroidota bacterium]
MGILNISPDSFFDGGLYTTESQIVKQATKILAEGADIIDIGAVSTRPDAATVNSEEEERRLLPAIKIVRKTFPDAIISIDTFRSEIAIKGAACGADIINDISGGTMDHAMPEAIASCGLPYIMMHIQGTPQTMQQNPEYNDIVSEIMQWFSEQISIFRAKGVKDIILDPGFGFGKTIEHNYTLLRELHTFTSLGLPVQAGISRKSFIYKTTGESPADVLPATSALHFVALNNGASLLRVHDVAAAVQVRKVFFKYS